MSRHSQLFTCVVIMSIATTAPAMTQESRAGGLLDRRPSVPELLRQFPAEARRERPQSSSVIMSSMISRSNELPSEVVDSLLVGLEDLVLAATDQQVRRSALGQLAIAGMHEHNDRFQIPNRLERIYHRSDDAFIRIQVVGLMSWQANQHAAAEVLREIVLEAPVVDESRPMVAEHPFRVPAIQAMHQLLRLGEPGRAVLRELHRSGQVRDPRVQRLLDERVREDFRDPG